MLHFRIISMSKRTHQIFFAAIIINLILILLFTELNTVRFVMCGFSLSAMILLPFGRKGGIYHRVVSSIGLILFVLVILIVN